MDNFEIYVFGGHDCVEILESCGYSDRQIVQGDLFEVSRQIFEAGLNTMQWRHSGIVTLCVDDKRFQQR